MFKGWGKKDKIIDEPIKSEPEYQLNDIIMITTAESINLVVGDNYRIADVLVSIKTNQFHYELKPVLSNDTHYVDRAEHPNAGRAWSKPNRLFSADIFTALKVRHTLIVQSAL